MKKDYTYLSKFKRHQNMSNSMKVLLGLFWIFAIILPICKMLSYMSNVDVVKIITGERFFEAFKNSIIVSLVATAFSVSLAGVLAWCTSRTAIRFTGIFAVLFTVPMLIPSISHGMGLIILFGSNGLFTSLLNIKFNIYGFWGIVLGSIMYSLPVAYLMILDILKFEDSTPYEAADVLGLTKVDKFKIITFPYMRKPMISVIFATFTMIITDYGVPLMIGGKYTTLPVMMYQDVIGMLDFGKGSVIGLVLLIPALIACLLDIMNRDKGNMAYVIKPFIIRKQKIKDLFAYFVCIITSICLILPIVTFSCVAFVKKYPINMDFSLENVLQSMRMNAGMYLLNSLIIAVCVSLMGTALAILCAYFTARMPSKYSRVLHLLSITSLAIPGLVLGLSYVVFFKKSFIYGTFAMLILVNTMHFFSSPYLMIYNTFCKLNINLEDVGKTLGIRRLYILKDVLIPMSKETIIEMLSYFFVNSMMTISAVSFLATASNKPIALMITQFEGQMQLECAAFVSFIILIVNMCVKCMVYLIKRLIRKA